MQGDISKEYGLVDRLAVLRVVRRHAPQLAPMSASHFERGATKVVFQGKNRSTTVEYLSESGKAARQAR